MYSLNVGRKTLYIRKKNTVLIDPYIYHNKVKITYVDFVFHI